MLLNDYECPKCFKLYEDLDSEMGPFLCGDCKVSLNKIITKSGFLPKKSFGGGAANDFKK